LSSVQRASTCRSGWRWTARERDSASLVTLAVGISVGVIRFLCVVVGGMWLVRLHRRWQERRDEVEKGDASNSCEKGPHHGDCTVSVETEKFEEPRGLVAEHSEEPLHSLRLVLECNPTDADTPIEHEEPLGNLRLVLESRQ
jgi:hypothetical protein